MIAVVDGRPSTLSLMRACDAVGLHRSTWYADSQRKRFMNHPPAPRQPVIQPRALSEAERTAVLDTLNSERFCDQPPVEVYHTLLDEGQYLCSVSTMHRLLKRQQLSGDRRAQRQITPQPVPRLKACAPNEVWTWDVTKLPLMTRGVYLSMYVVMDLFSRFIVAWMISRKENSALAQQLIQEAHARYRISDTLVLHQDRGAPMIANAYLDLLGELSITASHSRPRVSNDNAMSESQFKTMKYQPDYPRRFNSTEHARCWGADYVDWYNFGHHHSALAGFTPAQVFTEQYLDLARTRQAALDAQFQACPERFVRGRPKIALPASAVYINPLLTEDGKPDPAAAVNFPTLDRVKTMPS